MTAELTLVLVTFAEDGVDWPQLVATAQAADRAGVDRIVVSDHVVFGERLDDYARPEVGGIAGGRQPTGPDGHWLEPLTVLSALGAATTGVRLGTNVLQAALRRPVVLAKQLSTLDVITNGRIDLGVGVGWQQAEYEAAGLPFASRGRRLDHTLAVLHMLWQNRVAAFSDELLHFDRVHQMPKPAQPGGIPIWVGGSVNPRVARRLARFGDGWIPWGDATSDIAAGISGMRELVEHEGGDFDRIRVAAQVGARKDDRGVFDPEATMEPVTDLVAMGVSDVRVHIAPDPDPQVTEHRLTAAVDAFRRHVGVG